LNQIDLNTESFGAPKIALADSGYTTSTALTELESRPHISAYVPLQQDVHHERARQELSAFRQAAFFSLDPEEGLWNLPPWATDAASWDASVNKRGATYVSFGRNRLSQLCSAVGMHTIKIPLYRVTAR